MEFVRTATLIIATLSVGLMAGVMALYANTLMPGLGRTDDRTFVGAFQAIDTRIINPLFLLAFLGALVFTGLAALLHLAQEFRSVLPWIVVATALYLATVVITLVVNVPLNDGIKAAGSPDLIADLAAVRSAFNETKWVPVEPGQGCDYHSRFWMPCMGPGAAWSGNLTILTRSELYRLGRCCTDPGPGTYVLLRESDKKDSSCRTAEDL